MNTPIRYKRPLFRYGIWARIRGERTLPAICLQQYSACEAEFSLRNSTEVSQIFKVLLSLRDLISRNSFLKALVYVLLVQTTDTATFALCTAPVVDFCWYAVFIIDIMDFGTISKGKVQELKSFLRLRGLNLSGRKEELIARVFVAYENNVPLIKSAEDVQQEIALGYRTTGAILN